MSTFTSKRVKSIEFSVANSDEIQDYTVGNITSLELFEGNRPRYGGLFDARMGVVNRDFACLMCKETYKTCPGHFGRIELGKSVYYPHFLKDLIQILRIVCFHCKTIVDSRCNELYETSSKKNYVLFNNVFNMCKKRKRCTTCKGNTATYKRHHLNLMQTIVGSGHGKDGSDTRIFTADECLRFLMEVDDDVYT